MIAIYQYFVERSIRSSFDRFNAGDVDSVTRKFSRTAHFTFPGSSAWALDSRDPAQIRDWFVRFAAVGPQFKVIDVWARGWPWNIRVAVRMEDRIGDTYRNDVFQFLRIRWGRIVRDRLYLDTQAVTEFESGTPNQDSSS